MQVLERHMQARQNWPDQGKRLKKLLQRLATLEARVAELEQKVDKAR